MPVTIRTVETKKDQKAFINLSWQIYKGNPAWVPPLRRDLGRPLIRSETTFSAPVRFVSFWLATETGRRLLADRPEDECSQGEVEGYISLFECIEDYECARALLDAACAYLRTQGATAVRGPVSPTNGDDYRAFYLMILKTHPS